MPPLQATRDFCVIVIPRAGHTPPLPGGGYFNWRLPKGGKEGSRPLPTNYRKVSSHRQDAHFRQVCRGRIDASRAVYPLDCFVGRFARAAYMPPLQATRDFCVNVIPRAGHTPPLPGGSYLNWRLPKGGKEGSRPLPTNYRKVRSYRQDAHFRQVCRGRIDASRAVYPLDCIVGRIARAVVLYIATAGNFPLISHLR